MIGFLPKYLEPRGSADSTHRELLIVFLLARDFRWQGICMFCSERTPGHPNGTADGE
jgi:hypothetical protein